MLTIRQAQFAAFSQAELRKFENWMVAHLRKFFPDQCTALEEAKLIETIQYGIRRAATYEIKIKRDVCKYIDLMIILGRDFDSDGRYLWLSQILSRRIDSDIKMRVALRAVQLQLRIGR
jgi:hypothetical protein